MKKYIALFVISFAILFGSCSDYLDIRPEGEVASEEYDYKNSQKMFEPVAGIYAGSVTENGFSRWVLYGLMAVRADDTNKGGGEIDQFQLDYAKKFNYDQLLEFWGLNESWKGLYDLIEKSTGNLDVLDKFREHLTSDADIKLNDQYKAEIRFIRAYAYFYLTRMWGDVPIFSKSSDLLNPLSKMSRAEVYSFINDELDACIGALADKRPNEMPYKGQVTKYTALALKAKANSDINDWDAVLDATQQIINSGKLSLYPDYYQYFKRPGRLADETLFEMQYSDLGALVIRSDNWFAFQGPNIKAKREIVDTWGFLTASDKIVDLFKSRGETVRFKTTFLMRGETTEEGDEIVATNLHKAYSGKAYLPSTQMTEGIIQYGSGNNIRMLRYADVLLLNAEAKVRKSQNGDAPFNEVRRRAKMPELTNVSLDQILEERQVEFALEWAERYFDLIRTNRAKNVLPGFIEGKSEFYPIPQAQIDANPLLGEAVNR